MKNYFIPLGLRPRPTESGPRYADLYERGVAAAIDVTLIFFLFNWLFSRITTALYAHIDAVKFRAIDSTQGFAATFQQLLDANVMQMWLVNFAVQIVIIGVVYVMFQIAYATTPGKWLLGLKLVRYGTHENLKPWRYVLRYAAYAVSCAPIMLGILWASFNKQHRTWHDYIAGTVVMNTRPSGWYWMQIKRGYRKLRGRPSVAVEEPVAEPAAEQRHEDGKDAV